MNGLMMLSLLFATALHAEEPDSNDERARMLYGNGRMLFDEQRYEDALLAWQEAYRLSDRPLLLYNIALAHEKLGNYGEAIELLYTYRVYATPDEQAGLIEKIDELQFLIDSAPEDEPVPMPDLPAVAESEPAIVEPPVDTLGTGRRGATLAWAGAGVSGGVGLVFTALTINQRNAALEFCSNEASEDITFCLSEGEEEYIHLERLANIADVGWGLSVLSAGTALWMSSRSTTSSGRPGPVLWFGPGKLGIKGRF